MGPLLEISSTPGELCANGACGVAHTEPVEVALSQLAGFGPEYGAGFSNHAPMVVESFEFLGRPDLVVPWVGTNVGDLEPVTGSARTSLSLGDVNHTGWYHHFAELFEQSPVETVLADALDVLAGGVAGGAGHGLLRTWHAVRSWRRSPSAVRRNELARGLGYWASSYLEAPAAHPSGSVSLLDVLAAVEPQCDAPGTIVDRLVTLDADRVASLCATARIDDDPSVAAAQVVEASAVVLRRGPGTTALLHALTVADATRHLVDCCDTATARRLVFQSWGLLVSLYSLYGRPHVERSGDLPVSWAELIAAACRSGDPHDVKLVAAGLSATEAVDDNVLRTALTEVLGPRC